MASRCPSPQTAAADTADVQKLAGHQACARRPARRGQQVFWLQAVEDVQDARAQLLTGCAEPVCCQWVLLTAWMLGKHQPKLSWWLQAAAHELVRQVSCLQPGGADERGPAPAHTSVLLGHPWWPRPGAAPCSLPHTAALPPSSSKPRLCVQGLPYWARTRFRLKQPLAAELELRALAAEVVLPSRGPALPEPEIPHLPEDQAALLEDWITSTPHLPPPELDAGLQAAAWGAEDGRKVVMLTSGAAQP